jgi:hypothetical protein
MDQEHVTERTGSAANELVCFHRLHTATTGRFSSEKRKNKWIFSSKGGAPIPGNLPEDSTSARMKGH